MSTNLYSLEEKQADKPWPVATRVSVSWFDMHFWPASYHKEMLRDEVAFVVDPDAYHGYHRSGDPIDGDHFKIQAPWRDFAHSHLWRDYLDFPLLSLAQRRFKRWHLLVPFFCTPRDFSISFIPGEGAPGDAHAYSVRTDVWLWPFGWSSRLKCSIVAASSLEDVRDLVAWMESSACFQVGGRAKPKNLSGVFASLSRRMRRELTGSERLGDRRTLDRSLLVSLSRFTDPERCWAYTAGPNHPCGGLPFADRLRLHSAVLGSILDSWDLQDLEGEHLGGGLTVDRRFAISPLPEAGFAITHLSPPRTLLFLSETSRESEDRRVEQCLTENLCSVSRVIEALLAMVRAPERVAGGFPESLKDLNRLAVENLSELPERYPNPFCKRMFQVRRRLRDLTEAG